MVIDSIIGKSRMLVTPTTKQRAKEIAETWKRSLEEREQAVIIEKYGERGCNIGEDGGFAPNISSVQEGLDLVKEAISRTGYNYRIKIAIDVAATAFCIENLKEKVTTYVQRMKWVLSFWTLCDAVKFGKIRGKKRIGSVIIMVNCAQLTTNAKDPSG